MADDSTNAPTGTSAATTQKPKGSGSKAAKIAQPKTTVAKSKFRIVRSTLPSLGDGGDKVALHEFDKRHPGGEVFIAGATPVQVYPTAAVAGLVQKGTLKDITDGDDEEEGEEEAQTEESED